MIVTDNDVARMFMNENNELFGEKQFLKDLKPRFEEFHSILRAEYTPYSGLNFESFFDWWLLNWNQSLQWYKVRTLYLTKITKKFTWNL